MDLNFVDAITVGSPSDLVERTRETDATRIEIPSSSVARGLAIKSLQVTRNWDGLWGLLGRRQQIYFLSVAFDVSDHKPVIFPPKEVSEGAVHLVKRGETISFTLGDGLPLFPSRVITGGLIVYITVCEADKGIRHVGEVMAKVHEDLESEGSLSDVVKKLVKSPTKTIMDELLQVATAALQPVATILKNSKDDYIALFSGIYAAKGPWDDKLSATYNGTNITLAELR